jgi:hypothetical protein
LISACIIVGNADPTAAIESIRPRVDEVVCVRTAAGHGEPFFQECNFSSDCDCGCGSKAGDIQDFALARNRSFELAKGDWVTWIDTDDRVEGAPFPREPVGRMYYPYEYAPTSRLHLPRLVRRSEKWTYPIHEMLPDKPVGIVSGAVTWIHDRTPEGTVRSAMRNFRLLTHHMTVSEGVYRHDARMWYFYGKACLDLGSPIQALGKLARAFDLETWGEQKAMIAMDIARGMPTHLSDLKLEWGWKAARLKPLWPSVWRCLSGLHPEGSGERFELARFAASLHREKTILSVNPQEQT